jgi:hypothetical protein
MSLKMKLSVKEAVMRCAAEYNFDGGEALSKLLESVGKSVSKPKCPMPYSGEYNEECCKGLRQNKGLYTQCEMSKKSGDYCKQCSASAEKNSGMPEYGTIEQRRASDIYSYVDPKGRKPISYTKIMKKLNISEEEVKAEAEKLGISIDAGHFVVPETKRGRPAQEKAPKEPKGAKGRPKKAKKVLEIGGEEDDLFASLVAAAFPPLDPPLEKVEPNVETVEQNVAPEVVTNVAEIAAEIAPEVSTEVVEVAPEVVVEKKVSKKAESEAKKLEKEAKKLEKETQKAEKEAQKLEKEAKKKAELEAKEAKKKAELEAKEAKKKAEKEAKKIEKESKKAEKKPVVAAAAAAAKPSEEEEQEVVKKIEVDGKKYLKSKSTGIIYDYNEYVTSGEQVVVGKWNEATNKIDFQETAEESEDEYDE